MPIFRFVCGHETRLELQHCPAFDRDDPNSRGHNCGIVVFEPVNVPDTRCAEVDCQYFRLGGEWKCCKCGTGPNRTNMCGVLPGPSSWSRGLYLECTHRICEDCTGYLTVRVAAGVAQALSNIRERLRGSKGAGVGGGDESRPSDVIHLQMRYRHQSQKPEPTTGEAANGGSS